MEIRSEQTKDSWKRNSLNLCHSTMIFASINSIRGDMNQFRTNQTEDLTNKKKMK